MKNFLGKQFLLHNKTAQQLYHDYAEKMPIIDYHCHLSPQQIAEDTRFETLTAIWLNGDHYKWRAMRANGIGESFITGSKTDFQKFKKWADTVPYTIRNPLYHWTHLELQRYFDIHDVLNPDSAKKIYDSCTAALRTPEFSARNLIRKMNVRMICTTDDPVDNLEHHQKLKKEKFEIPVLPAFRPDAAMNVDNAVSFNNYIERLEKASGIAVGSFDQYLSALKQRHDFFAKNGCSVSDHGLEVIYAEDYSENEIKNIFDKLRSGQTPDDLERRKFKSAMLFYFAIWDAEKNWVQQFHLGAMRNNNRRMMKQLGPDTGWDSIGDFPQAKSLAKFLSRLDNEDKLAKTILYNLNPADNAVMAAMIGNFNDGSFPGKIQWGAAWWFLDQKDGMEKQINALSNMGLLSRFVGMLTDSRSFLSYPRHEYFRRILCNLFGEEIERGELPDDLTWIGKIIEDICFHNAKNYFGWEKLKA
ncbi:MAG: glucuronate isomerase [Bacteroidetes bacterium]|nr:glucuronate isomerase [Bacteroidota bacterium]